MSSTTLLIGFLAILGVVQASPVARQANDVANDWYNGECADLAVIFARGTFDSGNIGPWVGQPFRDALYGKFGPGKVAFQGVSASDYPANLDGYIEDGGPEGCAVSLGREVERYAARCLSSKFVISGWSQGALCAHKSLDAATALTSRDARDRVIAFVTFGDPISVWQDSISYPAVPGNAKALSYCQMTTRDPLCAVPFEDFPHSPKAFIAKLKAVWQDFDQAQLNGAQKSAISDLLLQLVEQASSKIGKLGSDILHGHIRRWMLTSQHFLYGLGPHPMVDQAAGDILQVYQSSTV